MDHLFSDVPGVKTQNVILNDNLELWMTRLPPYLKSIPIIHLAIPGSHNTMTYTISRFNDVGPDEPQYLRFLGRYLSLLSKPVIFNWSVTQYDDIKGQLTGGIRYLDLRLATKPNDHQIYFLHGLYGDTVASHLKDISDWLKEHPEEVIILDFQHFYSFNLNNHMSLVTIIKNIFGTRICPVSGILSSISIDWMVRRGYQVIIIYRNEIARLENDLWPSGLWPTPWPNTTDATELIDFLDSRLGTRLPDTGYVSQCLLTPDTKYVLRHLCGSLHRDLAVKCREVSIPWLEGHYPGDGGMNIVITDYVSFNNFQFSRLVIQRNRELLQHTHSFSLS
ncbi:PI-PLC X domain-containing protein 3 [Diachasma alloeum]|uniref:PI-PLC X domain-containing protein 3 n=1 Tax=Diachasma alloeum TaxID=454923 RepID=UPI00073824BA|nr:PI-PLC X domain-containing protein 3 [Diachasma alloeum]